MAQPVPQSSHADDDRPEAPDVSHLTTEDDEPVDNMLQDKQADILVEALRVSWEEGRPFLSATDVGIFPIAEDPAIVPDVLLSVGVQAPAGDPLLKGNRSYFIWKFGKPPEVVIEIVSNTKGGEDTTKLEQYARIKVPYYVIYDPAQHLGNRPLRIFQLSGASYVEKVDRFFPEVGLGLTLWEGSFDGWQVTWLRWVDKQGHLLATGEEARARADGERARADEERARADEERARADEERARADRLQQKLSQLGIDLEDL
jgi:Uma2 family endonuclease